MVKVMKAIKYIILIFILLIVFLLYVPKLFGWHEYMIRSDSMQPTIPKGAVVYLNNLKFEDIQIGDVIGYKHNMDIIVHRVNDIDESNSQLITKGDKNTVSDDYYVHSSMIIGKVSITIPFFGYLIQFFRSYQGIIVLIFMVVVLVISMRYHDGRKEQYEKDNS